MSSDDKVKIGYGESHPYDLKMNIAGVLENSVEHQNETADNENQNNDKVDEAENIQLIIMMTKLKETIKKYIMLQ